MNSLENFLAMLHGGRPEWLVYDVPTTEPVERKVREKTGLSSIEAFDLDFREKSAVYVGDDPAVWRAALEEAGFRFPENSVIGRFGMACVHPPTETLGEAVHLTEMLHPLSVIESVAELERLPWPDTSDPVHYTGYSTWCDEVHAAGKVARAAQECTVFEDTWYLRGMDNVFCDWAEENGISDWLLDYFTERSVHNCRAFVRAGIDFIRLGDDVGMQDRMLMSGETWRTHLQPRLKRVIDAIRDESGERKVWVQYHSDGDVSSIVEDLIEVGVDVLNPVQPECMNVGEVAARYGDRLALSGMIGTQTTMPFGTPDDVREAVALCRRLHAAGTRVIVAPTHVLEPDVPWENILAFVEAVRQPL